jgi:hypothetical protein
VTDAARAQILSRRDRVWWSDFKPLVAAPGRVRLEVVWERYERALSGEGRRVGRPISISRRYVVRGAARPRRDAPSAGEQRDPLGASA